MNPSMNQTDSNGNPAEKTSKMRMKGTFHMSIAFAHSRTRICQGLKDFPKDAEGPSIQPPTFQTLSKQAKALMMPPTNSSNVTFHRGKKGKGHGPKDLALHQLHLAPRLSVTIVHQVEQGRALLNQARAAKREESSLTLHGC